jgi:hypothetical protein
MSTVVPTIYNVITAPHIQATIFGWSNLLCYWIYVGNSMRVILQIWCQIQHTSSTLRYVNCGPEICNAITIPHYQASIFSWTYLSCYWRYLHNSMRATLQILCQIQSPTSGLRYVNCGPGHIQYIYSSAHSDFNIHLNVSALLLEIPRQFNARYTANLLPNTAHSLQFMLCDLCSRPYKKYVHLRIFRPKYSTVGSSPAIGGISTTQCALYGILGAKYSVHPTDYAMWTVVPDIYNVFTAPHIQSWIFDWTYLRCCLRYTDICMRVILQIWCQIQSTFSGLRHVNCGPGHIQSIFSTAYLGFNIQLKVAP